MSRHKPVITSTVSPLTKRQLDDLVGSHHLFASGSDAVEKAIVMLYYTIHQDDLLDTASAVGLNIPQGQWG